MREIMDRRWILSWVLYATAVSGGMVIFYGSGWQDANRVASQDAWALRLTAVAAVLILSFAAAAISRLLPNSLKIFRGLLAGVLTGLACQRLAVWIGDHYLGGYAHSANRLGMLMVEGYGMMMYILITPAIGILAWIRAEIASSPRRSNARRA